MKKLSTFIFPFSTTLALPCFAFLLLIFLSFPPRTTALINPALKECIQQGYTETHHDNVTFCLFPDGSECPVEAFNQGNCGQKFFKQHYCVTEGGFVWDEDICCPGLKYTTPENMPGQPTCQKNFMRDFKIKVFFLVSQLLIGGYIFLSIARKEYR